MSTGTSPSGTGSRQSSTPSGTSGEVQHASSTSRSGSNPSATSTHGQVATSTSPHGQQATSTSAHEQPHYTSYGTGYHNSHSYNAEHTIGATHTITGNVPHTTSVEHFRTITVVETITTFVPCSTPVATASHSTYYSSYLSLSTYTTIVTKTITDVEVIYPSATTGSSPHSAESGPGYTSVATPQGHNFVGDSTKSSSPDATYGPGSGSQYKTVTISDYSSGSPYAPHTITGSAPAAGSTCVPEKTIYSTVVVEITKTVEQPAYTHYESDKTVTLTVTLPNGQPYTITTVIYNYASTSQVAYATTVPNKNGPGSHVEYIYSTIGLHSNSASVQATSPAPFPTGKETLASSGTRFNTASGSVSQGPRATGTVSPSHSSTGSPRPSTSGHY